MGVGAGIGDVRQRRLAGRGIGPVTGQPVAPVLKSGFQSLFDQQSAEAGTIDKEVRFDDPPVGQDNRLYIPGFRRQTDVNHFALRPASHPRFSARRRKYRP